MLTYPTLVILLVLSINVSAEVFKCSDSQGKVFYRDSPCPENLAGQVLPVKPFDPDKISEAQYRLSRQVKAMTDREEKLQQMRNSERKLAALEKSAKAQEQQARAAWYKARQQQYSQPYPKANTFFYGRPWIVTPGLWPDPYKPHILPVIPKPKPGHASRQLVPR